VNFIGFSSFRNIRFCYIQHIISFVENEEVFVNFSAVDIALRKSGGKLAQLLVGQAAVGYVKGAEAREGIERRGVDEAALPPPGRDAAGFRALLLPCSAGVPPADRAPPPVVASLPVPEGFRVAVPAIPRAR
jgi:hypothetical protein